MTLAEENQILCDSSFAEHFIKIKKAEGLKKVGIYEVKHGEKVTVYNYYLKEGIGNPKLPLLKTKDI
jgi:hypothetical protein